MIASLGIILICILKAEGYIIKFMIGLLPFIIAISVVDFWYIIIPAQLIFFYFWFFKWQRRVSRNINNYYIVVLVTAFGTLDLLGLLFFVQQTVGVKPSLWIILSLTYIFVLSFILLIFSSIFLLLKRR